MKLTKKIILKGIITAESGLMIGGSGSSLEIGGTDKQVIRNPITKLPYIPGSSLKGKMRSLLEQTMGHIQEGGPTQNPAHISAQLFGHIGKNDKKLQQASRVIVRDGELCNPKDLGGTELLYTEVKAENSIDRITSAANPRFFERVPKTAKFSLEIVINVYDIDVQGSQFLKTVCNCLKLVQDDYLGGGGSRGNGKVNIKITELFERGIEYYTNDDKKQTHLQEKDKDKLLQYGIPLELL